MKKIGVIGAGWLGMDWVRSLSGNENHEVRYTRRTSGSDDVNGQFFRFVFGEPLPDDFMDGLDFLFITSTIPRDGQAELFHFIEELRSKLPGDCCICFTSTIGVYTAESGSVDENSPCVDQDSVYLRMEQLLLRNFPQQTIVLRLGGLTGEDRYPVFSLSGRKDIPGGQKSVNLVHREDVLSFFHCILHGKAANGIYNLVYPEHPSREEYYVQKAQEKKIPVPGFLTGTEQGKIVCSEKSRQIAGFGYQHRP